MNLRFRLRKRGGGHLFRRVGRGMLVAHFRFARIQAQPAMTVGVVDERVGLLGRVHARHRLEVLRLLAEPVFRGRPGERGEKFLFQFGQVDPVLRPLRTGHARRHRTEVLLQFQRISQLALAWNAEQPLGAVIILVKAAVRLAAARGPEIIHALGIDREKAHGRAVFGRHVRDRGAIHDWQCRRARSVKLDELADHFCLAQHLCVGEREVGGGDAFAQFAGQMDSDHVRREKINRLTEHACFGLDAADAPTHDPQAIDHGGVGIGAHQRVREIQRGRLIVDA